MKRALLERRVFVPLLCGYVALLVLAAWRHEIRPRVFDRATEIAGEALMFVGISPGVAVFTADRGGGPDEKIAALCLEVRGISEDGARRVYPGPGVSCPAPAPRLWVKGEEIFLSRASATMRAAAAAVRAGASDPGRIRFAKLLAQSIGAHFVSRDRAADPAADRYLLLWREERISYRTNSRSKRIVALLSWQRTSSRSTDTSTSKSTSTPTPRVFIAWRPNEATLRERGWGPSEP